MLQTNTPSVDREFYYYRQVKDAGFTCSVPKRSLSTNHVVTTNPSCVITDFPMPGNNYYVAAPAVANNFNSNKPIAKKKGLSGPLTEAQCDQLCQRLQALAVFNKTIQCPATLAGPELTTRIKQAEVDGAMKALSSNPLLGQFYLDEHIDCVKGIIGSNQAFAVRAYDAKQYYSGAVELETQRMFHFNKMQRESNAKQTERGVSFKSREYIKSADHAISTKFLTFMSQKMAESENCCRGSVTEAYDQSSAVHAQLKAALKAVEKSKKTSKKRGSGGGSKSKSKSSNKKGRKAPITSSDSDSDDNESSDEEEGASNLNSDSDSESEQDIRKAQAKAKAKAKKAKAKAKAKAKKGKGKGREPDPDSNSDSDSDTKSSSIEGKSSLSSNIKSLYEKTFNSNSNSNLSNDPYGFVNSLFPPLTLSQSALLKEMTKEQIKRDAMTAKRFQDMEDRHAQNLSSRRGRTPQSAASVASVNTRSASAKRKSRNKKDKLTSSDIDSSRKGLKFGFDKKTTTVTDSSDSDASEASPEPQGMRVGTNANRSRMAICTTPTIPEGNSISLKLEKPSNEETTHLMRNATVADRVLIDLDVGIFLPNNPAKLDCNSTNIVSRHPAKIGCDGTNIVSRHPAKIGCDGANVKLEPLLNLHTFVFHKLHTIGMKDYTRPISSHPNWAKMYGKSHKDFDRRVKGPERGKANPDEATLIEIAEELRIAHSGLSKEKFVTGCAYITSRDVLESIDGKLWDKYHDDPVLCPKMLSHHWSKRSVEKERTRSASGGSKKRRKTSHGSGSGSSSSSHGSKSSRGSKSA
jgi:hypothetical protein